MKNKRKLIAGLIIIVIGIVGVAVSFSPSYSKADQLVTFRDSTGYIPQEVIDAQLSNRAVIDFCLIIFDNATLRDQPVTRWCSEFSEWSRNNL